MNFNVLFQLFFIIIYYISYSYTHSASSSSALATGTAKFRKKADKEKGRLSKKKKIGSDDQAEGDEDTGKLLKSLIKKINYLI
jgi:hypothetical protein